jgi:hypothetical protein
MAVESKIRELLKGKPEVVTEEVNELDESAARPADKSQGDSTPPTQGSSDANPEQEKLESDDALSADAGKAATAKASKDGSKSASSSVAGDQTSPTQGSSETASTEGQVNKPGTKADVKAEDTESDDEVLEETVDDVTDEEVDAEIELDEESTEEVEEVDADEETLFEDDVATLFADEEELSEEFKTKAAGLFEAVVTARVSAEIEEIEKELAEEAKVAQETFMEEMVQKVDGYLNYVAENWMKENELAIERGLRNEITESFVGSLKEVFAEHYIEVPQEKYDVLGEMQSEIESLKAKLDESTEQKVELSTAKVELEKAAAIKEATADLTVTESEKFGKLVEDVAFDSDYAEKLSVIKENYFPAQKASEEDKLVDDESITESVDGSSPISIYTRAISKSVKR